MIILGIVILISLAYFIIRNRDKGPALEPPDPTKPAFIDKRDNQIYTEVTIGKQIWMGENLRATVFNDGTPIPMVKGTDDWANTITPAYCYFDNRKSAYRNIYGPLYNWFAVNTGKLCPTGWHVPTNAEWDTLRHFLDPGVDSVFSNHKDVAGLKMKEPGNAHWFNSDTITGTNESGFKALPAGCRTVYGVFFDIGADAGWWSSTADNFSPTDAVSYEIRERDGSNKLENFPSYKKFGFSIRCIKDK